MKKNDKNNNTGNQEIISDLKAFKFVINVKIVPTLKPKKSIWPKIKITILGKKGVNRKDIETIKEMLGK